MNPATNIIISEFYNKHILLYDYISERVILIEDVCLSYRFFNNNATSIPSICSERYVLKLNVFT